MLCGIHTSATAEALLSVLSMTEHINKNSSIHDVLQSLLYERDELFITMCSIVLHIVKCTVYKYR